MGIAMLLAAALFWVATALSVGEKTITFASQPLSTPPPGTFRFAVIGDYGANLQPELDVANLVKSWNPELIITLGDNNYPNGAASTIDPNIGQYYHEFIYPYVGSYGQGAPYNKFFPSLGNHDWVTAGAQPYLDYFTLYNNERYYDFIRGPVQFIAVDSDLAEPDGITAASTQGTWVRNRLAASTSPWKLVYMHHPPYSSGPNGQTPALQWPYRQWGASVVLTGHDHTYERIIRDNFPYFVNGLGGRDIHNFGTPIEGSIVRYNGDYGAMLVDATSARITFQFWSRGGVLIDTYSIDAPVQIETPTATASPTILVSTPTSTLTPTFTRAPVTVTATYTPTPSPTTSTASPTGTPPATSTPTPCSLQFYDVQPTDTFYPYVRCLACRGIISGYTEGTFRPNNQITRGQLAKMTSNAAGFSEPATGQTFQDVPSNNTFYEWIQRLTLRGYMTGYGCGGPGEPCVNNRPYFRPYSNATRGQTAKIVANAGSFNEPPVGQTFEDVPPTHTFYEFIQRLASRNVMQGYACGGAFEPCIPPGNRPYFRPGNDVTRGQSAKIVANTFFPGCQTP